MSAARERERQVIEAALLDPERFADLSAIVAADDFTDSSFRIFWRAMAGLAKRRDPLEPEAIIAEARRQGAPDDVASAARLLDAVQGRAVAYAATFHAREIANDSLRRSVQREALALVRDAQDPTRDPSELIDAAANRLRALAGDRGDAGLRRIGALATDLLPMLEEAHERRTPVVGVASGFAYLDRLTAGFQPGRVYLLGGRPRHGKSALASQIATHAARAGRAVAVFSLEMAAEEVGLRALAAETQLDAMDLRAGRLDSGAWGRVLSGLEELGDRRLFVDASARQTPDSIAARARALKRREGLDLVVVDYLQLLRSTERTRTRYDEVSAVSRELAAVAKDLGVPILALSQLSRDIEKSVTRVRRPQLADLRESGQLEQDAHVVAFIYRPELEIVSDDDRATPERLAGYAELIVRKNRSGPEGLVKLRFHGPTTSFVECLPGADSVADAP